VGIADSPTVLGHEQDEGEDMETDHDTMEAELTIAQP
jgi:hypothetical protein